MKKDFSSSRLLKKIVRLSSIFFAVGAFSYSNVSFADVAGIPNNPDFPNAQYPYAQAPDGCSGWQSTREVRDTWGPVNFTGACDNHDRCYYTRGLNWNTCNDRFYADLRTACERDLRTSKQVLAPTLRDPSRTIRVDLPPEPARLRACYTIASGYYAGVQAGVLLNVFNEAQDKQRRYEEWVASIRNPSAGRSFQKPGNNGSVSCNTFCGAANANGQPVWGNAIGINTGSNKPIGAAGICECTQTSNLFVKHGNNGTVTCGTYCRGSQWGQVGACVASFDNKNGTGRDSNYLPGFLNGPELTCTCVK